MSYNATLHAERWCIKHWDEMFLVFTLVISTLFILKGLGII